ncbi:hypothetical protein HN51_066936 [Arachis hypogaea]
MDFYSGSDKDSYVISIPANKNKKNINVMDNEVARKLVSYTVPKSMLKEISSDSDVKLDYSGSYRRLPTRRMSTAKRGSSRSSHLSAMIFSLLARRHRILPSGPTRMLRGSRH